MVVIVVLWLGLMAVAITASKRESDFKKAAIERGYAQHNPKTGDWEWIEPPMKLLEKR
jgi:hypothetical protein